MNIAIIHVHNLPPYWWIVAPAVMAVIIILFVCIHFWEKKNDRDREKYAKRPYIKRSLPVKLPEELKTRDVFIVADFTNQNDPIIQEVADYQTEMWGMEAPAFILKNAVQFDLQEGKSYEVEKDGKARIVNLKPVSVYIDKDTIIS